LRAGAGNVRRAARPRAARQFGTLVLATCRADDGLIRQPIGNCPIVPISLVFGLQVAADVRLCGPGVLRTSFAIAKERIMLTVRKQVVSLFVNRTTRQWIVRDPDGNFWIVPVVEDAWEHREPFDPTSDMDLEPVPGHYKYMLGLPF
jgi:hypothetical protein